MLNNIGVKYGLYLGLASTLFSVISYFINPKFIMTGIAYLSFIITIYFMWKGAVVERKNNEGMISFGEALKVTFLIYVIGNLILSIYTYLMFNVFDPSLNDLMREVSIEQAETVAKWMGAEDGALESLPDEMDKQDISMSFSMIFMNYLVSLIFPGFVFALVISAITKKENSSDTLD